MAKNDFIINGGEPAAPVVDDCITTHNQEIFYGLTKREYFAGLAMQGLLAQSNGSAISSDCAIGAKYCVDMADALLKELETRGE